MSNLDRSSMREQGCVACVHVRVRFFEVFLGVWCEMYPGDSFERSRQTFVHPMSNLLINHFIELFKMIVSTIMSAQTQFRSDGQTEI